ncbi:MAG: glycoside hydrolase family 25 protein [Bacteroidales bacterium]|nr:glycoside hydrolase family 25 protein [Bacteroidales bacterium]MCM1416552.1 glycoside hydrolase family 25 protein [bacterium]MCM1423108.1 glycoside hydrolase family 25 protein [bacterium]
MDSKRMKRVLIAMIAVFLAVIAVLALANLDAVKRKLGLAQAAPIQEEPEENPGMEEEESGQIGSNLSAFLSDETFFDPEVKFKSLESYSGRNVSLVMSSVAKDLRIMVVDSVGRLVTGTEFTVTIQNVGEYTDRDKDGVIYVDDLRSGEYSVSLNEQDGFRVPNTITTIQVRQDIEYRVLENIEYLMLTEDDIDPEKEDKAVNGAAEDADGTENMELQFDNGSAKLGIDVSKWNQEIDWAAVKEAGVEFAIIRCGYRGASTGALVIDPRYKENIEGAIEAGIPVGVYFFTQARDEVEAVEEASMVIRLIEDYDVDYPVFLDSESAGGKGRADGLDSDERTRAHRAFLQTIQAAGYETGVYASRNWLKDRIDMTRLSDYRIWLAEYADVPTYDEYYYHMWQYTSKGTVDGISTNVDLNLCYMNIDTSINHSKHAAGYSGVVNGDTGNVPTTE